MGKPKLGLKLWLRKWKNRLVKKTILPSTNSLLAILGLAVALKTYELAKNDTSQQEQIKRLDSLVTNQKNQTDILIGQTNTLIGIINELKKVNENSTTQTQLISNNAKPILQLYNYSVNINNTENLEFIFYVKNNGYRLASDIKCSGLLLKYDQGKITSHKTLIDLLDLPYQKELYPSIAYKYSISLKSSVMHPQEMNNTITVIKLVYFDKTINKSAIVLFFYRNTVVDENNYDFKDISSLPIRKTAETYLQSKKL